MIAVRICRSVDDLRRVVCRHRPDWMFEVEDDLMRIYSLGTSTGTQQREAKQTPPIMRSNEATPTVGANKASPTMGTKKTLPTVGGGKVWIITMLILHIF